MGINYSNLNNLTNRDSDNFNDTLVKEVDSKLLPLIKDLDGNIKYASVLSQEDYNTIKPDNDTAYFINNITDEPLSLTNILDVAVSWTNKEDKEPEFIWMLIGDTEIEYVYLYKMPLQSGLPELVKEYEGYVGGCLTFDGIFDYSNDHSKSIIITNNEPFVVLINSDGELYAFPSLKYKTKGTGNYKAIKIDGSYSNPVTAYSVDKGYCSDLFRKDDQGIVVAYAINEDGTSKLCYKQYGYPDMENPTYKLWSGRTEVCSKSEGIFRVNVRRLNDYRLGLTYNYWETKNNIKISKTGFRYSKRIYAGVAYHPEVIEISEIPTLKGILYGAITNENPSKVPNAGEMPLPVLQLASISEPRQISESFDKNVGQLIGKYEFDMIYQLSYIDEHIENYEEEADKLAKSQLQLEIINKEDLSKIIYQKDSDVNIGELLNWTIESDWPYDNYELECDPTYGNCTAVPYVKKVSIEKSRIILTLMGEKPPPIPFRIVPNTNWSSQINIRYRADSFNGEEDDKENTNCRNLSGWFALSDFKGSSYGRIPYAEIGAENHVLSDYTKRVFYDSKFIMKTAKTTSHKETFTINGFNYSDSFSVDLVEVSAIPQNLGVTINFSVRGFGSAECKGVKNIDV